MDNKKIELRTIFETQEETTYNCDYNLKNRGSKPNSRLPTNTEKIPDSISRIFDQICFLKAPARLEKTPARTEVQKLEENCFYIVNVYMK